MKKKSLTIWVFIVVTTLVAPVNAAKDKKQTPQSLKQQKGQLEEIEKYISRRRQGIEDYYRGQLAELRLRAETEIRLLEVAEKAVYSSLAAQAEVAETVLHINSYGYVRRGHFESTDGKLLQIKDSDREWYRGLQNAIDKAPKRFAMAQSRIAEKKNDILAKLEHEALRLENGKRYALTVGLADLEKRLKENVLKPKPEPTHGVVTGIVYSADKPSTVIDGKIVREGDTIHDVKVVKIHRDNVEFEKNGKVWKQKVRETTEKFWQ